MLYNNKQFTYIYATIGTISEAIAFVKPEFIVIINYWFASRGLDVKSVPLLCECIGAIMENGRN